MKSPGTNQSLDLRKVERIIEQFRLVGSPELQAQAMKTFLIVAVAHPEPVFLSEIRQRLGISHASTSRNVALMGKFNRHKEPGFDLLESYSNPMNYREKLVRLTPKGLSFARTLAEIVRKE